MSVPVWPTTFLRRPDVTVELVGNNDVFAADSGAEVISNRGPNKRKWTLTYPCLRSWVTHVLLPPNDALSEPQALAYLVNYANVNYGSWLFVCPLDGQTYTVRLEEDSFKLTQDGPKWWTASFSFIEVL